MKTNPADIDLAFRAINFIADRYHVTRADLEGCSREWRLVWPRWLAMQLVRNYTSLSWPKIGAIFNRSRNTVIHALKGVENQVQTSCPHGVELVHLLNAWELKVNTERSHPPRVG